MGDRRHATRFGGQLDGFDGGEPVALHVRGATVPEEVDERLRPVRNHSGFHEGICYVRAADNLAGGVSYDVLHGDRVAELSEPFHDAVVPDRPTATELLEAVLERSGARLEKIGEQVDLDTGVVDGEFDAGDEIDRESSRSFASLWDARKGVVIGERERIDAGGGGPSNDHIRCFGPVGCRRVHVEVDRHDVS